MSEPKVDEAESAEIFKTKVPKRKMIIAVTIFVSIIVVVAPVYFGTLQNSLLKNTGLAGVCNATTPGLAGSYIELRSDGTVYFHSQYGYGYSGTWELRGSNRTYMTTSTGMASYATIEGGTLTNDTGHTYVKRLQTIRMG